MLIAHGSARAPASAAQRRGAKNACTLSLFKCQKIKSTLDAHTVRILPQSVELTMSVTL